MHCYLVKIFIRCVAGYLQGIYSLKCMTRNGKLEHQLPIDPYWFVILVFRRHWSNLKYTLNGRNGACRRGKRTMWFKLANLKDTRNWPLRIRKFPNCGMPVPVQLEVNYGASSLLWGCCSESVTLWGDGRSRLKCNVECKQISCETRWTVIHFGTLAF